MSKLTEYKATVAKYLHKLGEYNKAVISVTGGVATTVAAVLGLGNTIPETLAGYLVAAGAALTSFGVWAKANQDKIDQLGDAGADILER